MHKHATMNRCFRLVWSAAKGAMEAVCGTARGRSKASGRNAAVLATAAIGALLTLFSDPAQAQKHKQAPATTALPTGAQVVSGSATLQQAGAQLTVHQASDKLITNWQSFNIGAGATVRFNQPGAASVALNRVISNDPSAIFGTLQSNGQVFLVNPSGVLFGASARVDVGGLVASSLQLADADFLAGRYRFGGPATSGAVGAGVCASSWPPHSASKVLSMALATPTAPRAALRARSKQRFRVACSCMSVFRQRSGLT